MLRAVLNKTEHLISHLKSQNFLSNHPNPKFIQVQIKQHSNNKVSFHNQTPLTFYVYMLNFFS